MFIHLLLIIWTFQFCLLIQETYSFRTPKHDSLFYYKTHASVFLTNPLNHTTSYGIYVAGQTITVDIPTSVANVFDILNWKVINVKKNQLMFVHQNKPYILINQTIISEMEYSGELSDSIIAFGDNEALHVPTIFNPNLTKPIPDWNYIELLHFDDQSEKVSVSRFLPWLKDDWKFIKEWNMTDYIHFDNKLYLAIKRSIWNEKSAKVTQEISIVRLCLDKGSELISSAVEIHFTQEAFENNKIIDLFFVFLSGPLITENQRYQLHTTQSQPSNFTIYYIYFIYDIVSLFEQTSNECASGFGNITLLRHHLRSEIGKCKKTSYQSCSTKANIVPSKNVSLIVTGQIPDLLDGALYGLAIFMPKPQFVTLPSPFDRAAILIRAKPFFLTKICKYRNLFSVPLECINLHANSISPDDISEFNEADFHTNKLPYGAVYVTKETNKILFIPIEVCSRLKTCTQCIMYGLNSGCIWFTSICVHDNQPKNKVTLTVDHCFKIMNISPLILNSSSPTILTIELDKPLIMASQEQLVIQAGDNHCTDIAMNGQFINCSMRLTKSGEFNIDVSLRNDRYADTSIISAVSSDKVHIFASDSDYTLIIISVLFSCLIINSFAFIVYFRKCNKKHLNRSKKVSRPRKVKQFVGTLSDKKFIKFFEPKKQTDLSAITPVKAQIVSSTMATLDDSRIINETSSEQASLWITMRSVPRQIFPRRKLLQSKPKQRPNDFSQLD
uniref:Sema domain-containing protein n=1 Tax=Tetranychus urticae TaxID=32264 RepID=A0A158P4V5_TETUR